MAEVPNRRDFEQQLGRSLGLVTIRRLRELKRLLGRPPRMANVPASFWTDLRNEIDSQLSAILLLIFIAAADEEGQPDSTAAAQQYASRRSSLAASWVVDSARDRLASAEASAIADPGMPDVATVIDVVFTPERIDVIATTEITAAQSAGTDYGIWTTRGLSERDLWITEDDGSVCKICRPLHQVGRSIWTRQFPAGPPAHINCRCWIQSEKKRQQPQEVVT